MKRILASVAIVAAGLAGTAQASDWSGAYIGGHVTGNSISGGMDAHTPWNGFAGFDLQGVTGGRAGAGVYGGVNWQTGNMVTGLEAELSHVGFKRSTTTGNLRSDFPRFDRQLEQIAVLTPRIGHAMDAVLIYGRAGLAVGRFASGHLQQGNEISGRTTRTGWLAGIGVEYRTSPNVSVRAGVDYMDFGRFRTDIAGAGGNPDIYTMQKARVTRATLGVTWHFN